jgi:hypothetical protein
VRQGVFIGVLVAVLIGVVVLTSAFRFMPAGHRAWHLQPAYKGARDFTAHR